MKNISPAELKEAAAELPPSPQIFGKLGKLLRDSNTGLGDITELVNTDSSLTTQVIRLSNSPLYAGNQSNHNLDDAINRIGFRELFKLVGSAAAADVFSSSNDTYGIDGSLLWENSLCCGLCMEQLAQKLGQDEQEAYTLGLLRSMGKTVIDTCQKSDPEAPTYKEHGNGQPLLQWEESAFGTTNPIVARYLLNAWSFPTATATSMLYQYQPEKAAVGSKSSLLLNIAGSIAEELGKGLPGESAYWSHISIHCVTLGLSESNINAIRERVEITLDQITASVAQ